MIRKLVNCLKAPKTSKVKKGPIPLNTTSMSEEVTVTQDISVTQEIIKPRRSFSRRVSYFALDIGTSTHNLYEEISLDSLCMYYKEAIENLNIAKNNLLSIHLMH